jgi:hypothetical protein
VSYTAEIPWLPGHTLTGDSEVRVRKVLDSMEAQRIRQTQWPKDNRAQMTALGRLFPTMLRRDGTTVPGIDPWDSAELVTWLNTSGEPTSGSRQAAMFLLSVWNGDDWTAHGLKVRKIPPGGWKGARRIGRFDFNDAWACWDEGHRNAALAWLTNPFWP